MADLLTLWHEDLLIILKNRQFEYDIKNYLLLLKPELLIKIENEEIRQTCNSGC